MSYICKRSMHGVRRAVFLLTAIAMVFSVLFTDGFVSGILDAFAADVGALDISEYRLWINGIDSDSGETPTVKDGDSIALIINWNVNNNEDTLYYETVIDSRGIEFKSFEGELYADGDYIGKYYIRTDENGVTTFAVELDPEAKKKSNIGGGALLEGVISLDRNDDLINGSSETVVGGEKSCTVTYDDGGGHGRVDLEKTVVKSSSRDDDIKVKDGKLYADYAVKATVVGMIDSFTLDDELVAGVTIVAPITVEDENGNIAEYESFPITISTEDHTKKSDSSVFTVTYKAEIPEDVNNQYAAETDTADRKIPNTATASYVDDIGVSQSTESTASVTSRRPSVSKSVSEKKVSELETVFGVYTAANNPATPGGPITDLNARYYVLEWQISINPVSGTELTDEDIKSAIMSIRDSMKDSTGKNIWAPYNSDYISIDKNSGKRNDTLSTILYRCCSEGSEITEADYESIIRDSYNFSKSRNGAVTLKYKTVIVDTEFYKSDSGKGITVNNNVEITVKEVPITSTGSATLDFGIDVLSKDIVLGYDDVNKSTNTGNSLNDWETADERNVLKPGLSLPENVSDGQIYVPFRIVIDADEIQRLLSDNNNNNRGMGNVGITIGDSWATTNGFIQHYIKDLDEFKSNFHIYFWDNNNKKYVDDIGLSALRDNLTNDILLKLTGDTRLNGDWVNTGWTAELNASWLNHYTSEGYDIVITYCTRVNMTKDENGKYVLNPAIMEKGGYNFNNTATIKVRLYDLVLSDEASFTLDYEYTKPEPEFDNITKKYVSGECGYSDTDTFKLTDPDKYQLGWCIRIPTVGLKAGDSLVINDTLPEGLSLVPQVPGDLSTGYGVYTNYSKYDTVIESDKSYEEYKFEDYEVKTTDDGFTITIKVTQEMLDKAQELAGAGKTPMPIRIYYVTRYDSGYVTREGSVKFINTATAVVNDTSRKPSSDNTTVGAPNIADKLMLTEESAIWDEKSHVISAEYALDINIGGDILDLDSDKLTVIDTMADCMTLDEGSVAFHDGIADGDIIKEGCSFTTDGNKITFVVPDGKHVVITYKVIISANPYSDMTPDDDDYDIRYADPISNPYWWQDVVNSFSIEGIEQDEDHTSSQFPDFTGMIRAWAYNTTGSITIYKYYEDERGNIISLKDAKFVLRRVYDNNGKSYPADDKFAEFTITDANGKKTIDKLPLDMIYKLEEVEPPAGFTGEGKREFYFVLQGAYGVEDPRDIVSPTADEKALADMLTKIYGTDPLPIYKDAETVDYNNFEAVDIDIVKTWADFGHSDYRPDNIEISLRRKIEGGTWETVSFPAITWTKSGDTWKGTIKSLRKYDDNGKEYIYEVSEKKADNYLNPQYSGNWKQNITNTLDTVELSVKKNWLGDAKYVNDYRPDDIVVQVLADGKVLSGKTLVLNDANNWSGSVKELPKYTKDGKEITYTVKELAVTGYTSDVQKAGANSFIINNTFETVDLTVTKNWIGDEKYADKYRPEKIVVQVLADGKELDGVTLTLEKSDWTATVYDLPKYDTSGKEITYTVKELDVTGYVSDADKGENNSFIINNTFETVDLTVTKNWIGDEKYADKYRPEKIVVQVLADGKELDGVTLTLDKNSWAGLLNNLPRYDTSGKEITYTVREIEVAGYVSETQESGKNKFIINNTLETVSVSGTKTWLGDESFADAIRPEEITIVLYANGERCDTAVCAAAGDWEFSFDGLPKYDVSGEEIVYTVSEEDVPEGYDSDAELVSDSDGVIVYSLLNTFTEELTDITVVKTWDDNENAGKIRPEKITVILLADGEKMMEAQITAAEHAIGDNEWAYEFTSLPMYATYKVVDGKIVGDRKIVYTAAEVDTDNYDKTEDGLSIRNTLHNEVTSISGTKVWEDNGNKNKTRPEAITVILHDNVNGALDCQPVWDTETDPDNWTYTFSDLPVYAYVDGVRITLEYYVTEEPVSGYTTSIEGLTITNKLITTDMTVNKLDVKNDEEVEGAKLELYDENDVKIGEWISAKGATWDVEDLIPGRKYTIKEAETPEGYETADDTLFTVDIDGKITIISGDDASIGENGELIINDAAVTVASGDDDNDTGLDTDTDTDDDVPKTGDIVYPTTAIIVMLVLTAIAVKRTRARR